MCPNSGTPKNNKFSIWKKMENLLFLGAPILKHITVFFANSVDSDQTSHSMAYDLGLNCFSVFLLRKAKY